MRLIPAALCVIFAAALPQAFAQSVIDTQDYKVRVTKVVEGLNHPWSMAFLPDGRMLVTERRGLLRVIENGKLLAAPVEGIPRSPSTDKAGCSTCPSTPRMPKTAGFTGHTMLSTQPDCMAPSWPGENWAARRKVRA